MKQALIYSLKAWLTTSLLAPLLITVIRFILLRNYLTSSDIGNYQIDRQYHRFMLQQLHMVLGGFIFLIPFGFALCYCIFFLNKRQVPCHQYKRYLSITAIVFSLLPDLLSACFFSVSVRFLIVEGSCYLIPALISVWFYNPKPINHKPIDPS